MKIKQITLALFLLLFAGNCLAQKQLFEKFSKMEGVTSVYISKTMLQMMPDMEIQPGMDLQGFAGRLTGILILTSENESITKQMREATAGFHDNEAYEILMKVKDEESMVNFYIRKKSDQRIAELLMLVDDEDEFVIIQMLGDLTMEDIQKLTKGMDIKMK
jgi:hypothetical protein